MQWYQHIPTLKAHKANEMTSVMKRLGFSIDSDLVAFGDGEFIMRISSDGTISTRR